MTLRRCLASAAVGALFALAVSCDRTPVAPPGETPAARRARLGLRPPPARAATVCNDGMYELPTEYGCQSDDDCVDCHDGSDCGVVVSVAEYERRGRACKREDAAACERHVPRCCDGRCVRSSH